jgi:hypothetical protein
VTGSGYHLSTHNEFIETQCYRMRAKTYVSMTVPHYSVWLASGGVPNVLDFEASLLFATSLSLDLSVIFVGIGGVIYSYFLESRVNVTGPYVPAAAKSVGRKRNAVHQLASPH